MEALLVTMDFDLDSDQIAQVVSALNPEMYTAFSAASLKAGGLFDRAMAGRLDALARGRALGRAEAESPLGWNLWTRALGMWADQDAAKGYLGRGQITGGSALGADLALNHWLILGLASGITRTDLNWSKGSYEGKIDAVHTGIYTRAALGKFFARLPASYSHLSCSAIRPIGFEGYSGQALGDYNADLYAASFALGYQARYSAWLLEPLAGLHGQMLSEEGFSERGGDFLNLQAEGRDTDSLLTRLGLGLSRMFRAGDWEILPRLSLSWQHQLGDERPGLTASFTGYGDAPFRVQGAELPGDAFVAGAGLDMSLDSGLEFFVNYRLAMADDYLAQSVNAGLTIRF
jgi:outer membrane autotransporter protein